MRVEFRVGSQNYPDGVEVPGRQGTGGDLIKSDLNAKYYEQVNRGNMFIYNVTTAAALLLPAITGLHPTIWNPTGSGKIFVPVALRLCFVAGATVIGSVVFAWTGNTGAQIAATAPIVAWTDGVSRNANLGSGKASVMRWSAGVTTTFLAAPLTVAASGINFGALAPTVQSTYELLLDGSLIIPPGNAISICYSVGTSTSTWITTLWGMELQIPAIAT
jgi:hypothetical protein